MSRTEFVIRATLEEIDSLTRSLAELAGPCLPPEKIVGLEIAVAEALNNIVLHGYGPWGDGTISAAITLQEDGATVEISHRGRQVPPGTFETASSVAELDPLAESGRGTGLIVGLSDRLDYVSAPEGNLLTLRFEGRQECPPAASAMAGVAGAGSFRTPRAVRRDEAGGL